MVVLDTSVIIKWLIEEEDTPLALEFQQAHVNDRERIAVPELLFYETCNVLAAKGIFTQREAEAALSLLFEFELETYSLGWEEFCLSLALSYRYKITIYDAVYIALAQVLGCRFITADKRLFEKVKELRDVKLLSSGRMRRQVGRTKSR
jgi:predicted nucleic acid-binding protein